MAKTKRDEREEPTPTTPTRPLENLMPPSHDARPPTPRARLCPRPPSRIQQSHLGCAGLCKSPRSCRFRGRSGPPASRWPTTEAAVCGGGGEDDIKPATSRCSNCLCSEAPGLWVRAS
ncbi:hypothetical protein RB597_005549 [Gaeumannomyces tritici]